MSIIEQARADIVTILKKAGVNAAPADVVFPPDSKLGDLALPLFALGKVRKMAPGALAQELVKKMKEDGKRVPGFGHKIYTTDPRTVELFDLVEKYGVKGNHCKFAEELEAALEKISGRKLCLNIDGSIAALISDMGFDWRLGKGIFIIGRTVGIVAHTHEEITKEKPYRRLEDEEVEYDGPEKRELPKEYRRK